MLNDRISIIVEKQFDLRKAPCKLFQTGREGPLPNLGGSSGNGLELAAPKGLAGSWVGRVRGVQGRSTFFNGQELAKSFKIAECAPPRPGGVPGARTKAPRRDSGPQFGPKRKLSGPRLHLTPHRPSTRPHARQAARPAPPRPGRPERGGGGQINSTLTGIRGASARCPREVGSGAHSPLLGPDAPVPAARACRPAGEPPGRRGIRPRSVAVAPGGPGDSRGRAEARGAAAGRGRCGAYRPEAYRRTPSRRTPAPGPRRPRRSPRSGSGWTPAHPPSQPSGAPEALRPPASTTRRRPHSPFHSPPGAWRGPANPRPHIRVRGDGNGLGSSAAAATVPPGLRREPFPVKQEGQEGRAAGAVQEEAAASYSTTTGTART
ncbi:translation initiation factor IF-2-like [Cebus imitator]|uniref:translation initiation factor IF-2-like n=1 Tax=Cebus imitator TaxID=2715852 RepID=UPI001898EA55|nr:translation initiation factor IF-2-like [Cebus imitator]